MKDRMYKTTFLHYPAHRPLLVLFLVGLFTAVLLVACGGSGESVLPTPIVEPAQPVATTPAEATVAPTLPATPGASPTGVPAETAAATPTVVPTIAATVTTAATGTTAAPVATDEPDETGAYRVVFVTADDVLNVREGPGVESPVVGELAADAAGVAVEEQRQAIVQESTWVVVEQGNVEGWVNSRFLTEEVATADFCDNAEVLALLEDLGTAIASEDGLLLGTLIHPERGLRIRHDWWNPEIFIPGESAADLFTSSESYEWGTQDGSGFDIRGTFGEVILPTLAGDYLAATELGCDEIRSGATAGLVQVPEEYEPLHFYSVYRPATDESGFDWGTWVVGIDRWQGEYYIAYLVHFDYEI
jgi:hypothetical protein